MTANPVGWFEIYVQDMARARAFYEKVLATTLEKLPVEGLEMWNFPMDDKRVGSAGALVCCAGYPSGGNSTVVYFQCADCGVEGGRVVAAGGKIEKEKFSIGPYGFIVLAYDPDGNLFGLHSMARGPGVSARRRAEARSRRVRRPSRAPGLTARPAGRRPRPSRALPS